MASPLNLGTCLLLAAVNSGAADLWNDEALSLLQLKSHTIHTANITRSRDVPGDRERQMCPHEIEEQLAQQGGKTFGCRGTLRAERTKECSFWGEPHISATWPSQHVSGRFSTNFDVLYKSGLFRLAAADDGSWEVQIMNCGIYAGSLAARFGKNVLEIVAPPKGGGDLIYFLNGKEYHGDWPIEQGQLFVDNTHRKIRSNVQCITQGGHRNCANNNGVVAAQSGGSGACIDDPSGQIYVEVYKDPNGNINVLLEAKDGSFTARANDGFSLCNVAAGGPGMAGWKVHNWPVELIKAEDSLFMASGNRACAYCESIGWGGTQVAHKDVAQSTCEAMAPTRYDEFDMERTCQEHGIALESAQAACVHLQSDTQFFYDCQLDFCASDGDPDAVAGAEAEEHAENPQPVCAVADDACDPAGACCNAIKDQAILDLSTVIENNLCGDGDGAHELRYGNVLTQKGNSMDLVVTAVGERECGRATNAKNGAKGAIGVIAVQGGEEVTFLFSFMKSGTSDPAVPTSLMFSFLDLDQGKKNKQRESVEVCGAVNAIVTDNSELEQSSNGDCIKFTSTTAGTGKDNPDRVESMSNVQRARTVAYQIAGSSFSATLGVAKKGHTPRKFMFAGNPSVACVLN